MRSLLPLTVLALGVPLASSAQQGVTCGATLTESITLTEDLYCAGPALVIPYGGSGPITLDLGGHTVSSTFPTYQKFDATIRVQPGGSVVRNGRVVTTGVRPAIRFDSGHNTVEDLTIDGGAIAFSAFQSGSSVADSHFVNGGSVGCTDGSMSIQNSTFTGPSSEGTAAISGYLCAISASRNIIVGYPHAIYSNDVVDRSNRLTDNVIDGGGISILRSVDRAIHTVSGNQVTAAPENGILVTEFTQPHLISHPRLNLKLNNNVVVGSGGDGIHILNNNGGDVTIAGNLALGNLGLGIDAANATDGGVNRAGGNGDSLQCVGVLCGQLDLPSELCEDRQQHRDRHEWRPEWRGQGGERR